MGSSSRKTKRNKNRKKPQPDRPAQLSTDTPSATSDFISEKKQCCSSKKLKVSHTTTIPPTTSSNPHYQDIINSDSQANSTTLTLSTIGAGDTTAPLASSIRHTTASSSSSSSEHDQEASASTSSYRHILGNSEEGNDDLGNAIVDLNLLSNLFQRLSCPECNNLLPKPTVISRGGLSLNLSLECVCGFETNQDLSRRVDLSQGRSYDINRRFTYAVTSIGGHDATARALCGNLNLSPPVFSYDDHIAVLSNAAKEIATESMQTAVREAKSKLECDDIDVSVDGTWQRRGFSSKNGVVTCLSNVGKHEGSKVVDVEVLTTYCHTCTQLDNDNTKLAALVEDHNCSVNHEGSAGSMEVQGALRIFGRSISTRETRYKNFLGDGDSKTYSEVAQSEPYGKDVPVRKQECTGHVQKRMGKQLISLVEGHKGKSIIVNNQDQLVEVRNSDSKKPIKSSERVVRGLGGAKGLTKKAIKSIQGHYGGAVRSNSTVSDMKTAIDKIFTHRTGVHDSCPDWCPATQGKPDDADKHKLPPFVCSIMRPVFNTLSDESLLEKCTHGGTQNSNESFHNVIWTRCPKTVFVGRKRLELAVADATIVFNDGEVGRLAVFQRLGLKVGNHQMKYAIGIDTKRVAFAMRAVNDDIMASRKRKKINHAPKDNTYASGAY